ncbi:MAG: hypothetical protein LC778_10570 [Acidobacteria bacterium]|nr:hypothetical protein [Acidobacteriota bacterium]
MNDLPRQKLVEIIAKHGMSVVENARRCEGLLRDYCGGFRREVSVLTMAVDERVPLDLLAAAVKNTPRQILLNRLAQRLCENLALSETAARWAVNSWAFARRMYRRTKSQFKHQPSFPHTATAILQQLEKR